LWIVSATATRSASTSRWKACSEGLRRRRRNGPLKQRLTAQF
jgi:hypothetical protein